MSEIAPAATEDGLGATPVSAEAAAIREGRMQEGRRGGMRAVVARGTIINAAFAVGLDTLNLVKGFLVAGFLTTAEYGTWGILVVALGTLAFLAQIGIGDKFVQQSEEDQEAAFQKAFTLECIVNGGLLVLVLAALPLFALAYGRWEIIGPGLLLATTIPAVTLQSPLWVYYRQMRFLRQRTLQLADPLVTFAVTVALAVAGAGYWSLVIGVFAGRWAGALVAVLARPYRLGIRYDRGTLREYWSFSWPVFIASASGVVVAQTALLVGEGELGLEGAGALALASSITLYADKVDAVVTSTLYPAICAVRERADLLQEAFVKSNRLALMWGVPFGVGLALFAPDLVEFVIGSNWQPAVILMQIFGGIAAINHIGFNWSAFYRARGETRPMAVSAVIAMVLFVSIALPLLVSHGLRGFGIGMAVAAAGSLAVRTWYLTRLFQGFAMLAHSLRAITPTIPAAGAVLVVRALDEGSRTGALAGGELALYLVVTVLATMAFERPLLREVAGYLRRRAEAAPAA